MSGIFPFAAESLTQLRIQKKDGKGINLIPWIYSATNPLVTFSLVENMFTPLMTGTIIVKDVGDWSGEMDLNAFDEVVVKLASKRVSGDLGTGTEDEERFKTYNLKFEITNIKNTVNLANSAYQNGLETAKALTIEFVSKSVLTKEFLSSLLEEDNFIGPIINSNVENFELSGTQANTVSLKGFNNYLKEKLDITLDGDRTWNYCYLKKNNVSYPWGKLKGQPTILQTLQYLSENAVSYENNKVVNYLFWQDLSGYHFRSIDSLIQQNEESAKDFTYKFTDLDLQTDSIRSFETLTEFDTLNLLSEKAYFTWYERIIPDYADPYIDFVDSSDALKRKNISFDASQEYSQINHIENGKLFPDGLTQDIDPKYKKLTESRRTDDDIYGFYSKNRYNTPHPQEWDYLGISADTRLSNVVWQNQYDIDDEVYPEILYAYDKLIKKELEKNRELYVNLKNAKRKWEVYRCSVCCLDQLGGTADQQIIKSLSSDSPDYVYYFGPTGIFGDIQSDGYGIVAAGAFSDVVNYLPGVSGVSGNGLTLSYDMNSYPYNQTIGEFYHLKQNALDIEQQIDNLVVEYQTELNKINPYITKIENDFLPFVDSWITEATNFMFDNLTPGYRTDCTCPTDPNQAPYCCADLDITFDNDCYDGQCRDWWGTFYWLLWGYPRSGSTTYGTLKYVKHGQQIVSLGDYNFNFGIYSCGYVVKLPLYVNLQFDPSNFNSYPLNFSGYWFTVTRLTGYFVDPLNPYAFAYGDQYYPWYVSPAAKVIKDISGCDIDLVAGPMAYELPFQKPSFLYQCSKTKLLTGKYYRTYQDPLFTFNSTAPATTPLGFEDASVSRDNFNIIDVDGESAWSDINLLNGVNNETIWCETCLDPIALQHSKFEYTKVLKSLKIRKYVIETLISKLQTIKSTFLTKYQEFLNRKAFFISKNPFDSTQPGNIVNKKSSLNLMNIKSIRRKPIRGSRYEVLAKSYGITSGVGTYLYNVYFSDNTTRNTGITGNHPYYDQKYKEFTTENSSYSKNYATKPGFDSQKFIFGDIYYYDNDYTYLTRPNTPGPGDLPGSEIGFLSNSYPSPQLGSLVLPRGIDALNNLNYPSASIEDPLGSISLYLPPNKSLTDMTNKYNVFTNENNKRPPSIVKEEIASYVRIEFINPIGLDRLVDFPKGFVRDAGSEYFLPYLVQLTAGPNGRQTIQSNAVIIGMDPYGFDVAIKKNKTKQTYSNYKDWGYYWWHTPVSRLRMEARTKDISDLSLWAEKEIENEYTYFENNGFYLHEIGADYTEYDNYSGLASGLFNRLGGTNLQYGSFYREFENSGFYDSFNSVIDQINESSTYHITTSNGRIRTPKPNDLKSLYSTKYGSYYLLGSHLHYNTRRSWYDFTFPSKFYFDNMLKNIANWNNIINISEDRFKVETLIKADDFSAFGGNDFLVAFENSIELKDTAPLRAFLQSNNIDNLIYNNNDFDGDEILSHFAKGISLSNQTGALTQIFSDDIEYYLNQAFALYRPGLVTSQVWKYDIFGESEYGLTSPPTLPAEYDNFDNNFAAQFVVFARENSELSICKKLNLKCVNPKGKTSNIECPDSDPYCNCPAKNIMPKEREPSYKELMIAYNNTKECELIEKVLGKDYLGCIISDDKNVASCNCPEQGKFFPTFLNTIRSSATFYVTPPETPLRRRAQMMMFGAQKALMAIYPNDAIKIGTIITVDNRNPSSDYKNKYDRMSGKWMVTAINRTFKSVNIEMMTLTLSRDSYHQDGPTIDPVTYKKDIF